jgi:hypothetical protein
MSSSNRDGTLGFGQTSGVIETLDAYALISTD